MARVFLYEDTGGSLYIHRHGDDFVYAHVEVMVPYGATFAQDASEIADGRAVQSDAVLKIPYEEMEPKILDAQMRQIAVWDDGKMRRMAHPGRDGVQYLQSPDEINPAYDIGDRPGI